MKKWRLGNKCQDKSSGRIPFKYGIFVLITAISALSGCANLPPAERQLLRQASDMYQRGEVSSATARLDKLINEYGNAVEIAEVYYLRGLCRTRVKQLAAAEEDFERALGKSKRADLTARCKASLASIAYQRNDWAKAAEYYNDAVPHLPDQPPTDQILYCAGVSLQRIGEWKAAVFKFGQILRKFRNRPIAADARQMAAWKHEYFSIQLGAFQDVQKAARAVQSFKKRGLADAVHENQPRDGKSLWVVMAGRYATYAQAITALPRVRTIAADAFIIP